jgi:hypothetical protein
MFVRIAPKPIGRRSSGSNFLFIAKNNRSKPTNIIID